MTAVQLKEPSPAVRVGAVVYFMAASFAVQLFTKARAAAASPKRRRRRLAWRPSPSLPSPALLTAGPVAALQAVVTTFSFDFSLTLAFLQAGAS